MVIFSLSINGDISNLINKSTSNNKLIFNIKINELIEEAENGIPAAQCLLGLYYKSGEYGLKKDEEKGIYWISKSASNGYLSAQEWLAGYYRDENTYYEKSWDWGLKAANQGSGEAMRVLAGYALHGYGCNKDFTESIKWLLLSASTGEAASKMWLSELEYKLNIFEKTEFFHAYNLAKIWIEAYQHQKLKIDQTYIEKFEQFCRKNNACLTNCKR